MNSVRVTRAAVLVAAATAALLALAACDETDPTAPADSTITVDANPQTVVVPAGGEGVAEIRATLRSKNGTRLPDQEIQFSTNAGRFDPADDNPVLTDDQGEAVIDLFTPSAATVTARSGSITGMTQIQTSSGQLTQFILTVDTNVLSSCSQMLEFTGFVEDPNGTPLAGVRVIFTEVQGGSPLGTFSSGGQVNTDMNGEAAVTWTPNSTCDMRCTDSGDPNGPGICELEVVAGDISGNFDSVPQIINDNIP